MSQHIAFTAQAPQNAQEEGLERGYSFFAGKKSLWRKASSFLARQIALETYPIALSEPIVSFVFDDIPVSAFEIAAPLLEEAGVRGTFYIATGLCDTYSSGSRKANFGEIQTLAKRGHEIALHTHEHLPIFVYNRAMMHEDISLNYRLLAAQSPQVTRNFAAPYGALSIWHKFTLRHKLRSIRSILYGINTQRLDPFCLKIMNLDADNLSDAQVLAALHQAQKEKAWVIFMSHNVAETQGFITTSVARLKLLLEKSHELGFDVLSIEAALDKIGVPPAKKEFSFA